MSRARRIVVCCGLIAAMVSGCGVDQVENLARIECGADSSNFNTICALPDFQDASVEPRTQAVKVYFKEDLQGVDECASLWSTQPQALAQTSVEVPYPFPSTELPGAPIKLSNYSALNVFVYAFDQNIELSVATAISGGCVNAMIPAEVADNNPINSKGMVVKVPLELRR